MWEKVHWYWQTHNSITQLRRSHQLSRGILASFSSLLVLWQFCCHVALWWSISLASLPAAEGKPLRPCTHQTANRVSNKPADKVERSSAKEPDSKWRSKHKRRLDVRLLPGDRRHYDKEILMFYCICWICKQATVEFKSSKNKKRILTQSKIHWKNLGGLVQTGKHITTATLKSFPWHSWHLKFRILLLCFLPEIRHSHRRDLKRKVSWARCTL